MCIGPSINEKVTVLSRYWVIKTYDDRPYFRFGSTLSHHKKTVAAYSVGQEVLTPSRTPMLVPLKYCPSQTFSVMGQPR